jgi:hypothetical protein
MKFSHKLPKELIVLLSAKSKIEAFEREHFGNALSPLQIKERENLRQAEVSARNILHEIIQQSVQKQLFWKEGLRDGRKSAWRLVYRVCFKPTVGLLKAKYGLQDDGKDLFQEALIVLYEYLNNT